MKKSVKKSAPQSFVTNSSIRRTWPEGIKPYGSVIGNKKGKKLEKLARKTMKEAM